MNWWSEDLFDLVAFNKMTVKNKFPMPRIEYILDRRFSAKSTSRAGTISVKLDPAKAEQVQNWEVPKTVYDGKTCRQRVVLSKEAMEAFEALKVAVTQAPCVILASWDDPFEAIEDVSENDESEVTSEDSFEDSESSTICSSHDEADLAYLSKDECSLVEVKSVCAMGREEDIDMPYKNVEELMQPKLEECIGEINDDEFEELRLLEAGFSMEPTIISLDTISEKNANQGILNACSEDEHVYETMHEIPFLDDWDVESLQNDAPKPEVDDCMHNNIVKGMKRISAMQNENQNHVIVHVQELDVFNNIERDENAIIDNFLTYFDKKESEDADDDIMAIVPYEKIQDMLPIEEDYNVLFVTSQRCFIGQKVMQSCNLTNVARNLFMVDETFISYYPQQDLIEWVFVDNLSYLKKCNFE
ncbi:hypothetical protein L7F22_048747 [Adiantum nelumboides]|nr:hypothetical protein [Adiantum nelumboides]